MMLRFLPFLFFIAVESQNQSPTAKIIPKNIDSAVLDSDKSTTFSCIVTGADGANWLVDGLYADNSRIRKRGITLSILETLEVLSRLYRRNITIPHNVANSETKLTCEADVLIGGDVHSSPVFFRVIQDTKVAITTKESQDASTIETGSDTTGSTQGAPSPTIGVIAGVVVPTITLLMLLIIALIIITICVTRSRNHPKGDNGTGSEENLKS